MCPVDVSASGQHPDAVAERRHPAQRPKRRLHRQTSPRGSHPEHGRVEYRSIRTVDIPDASDMPGAAWVFHIVATLAPHRSAARLIERET